MKDALVGISCRALREHTPRHCKSIRQLDLSPGKRTFGSQRHQDLLWRHTVSHLDVGSTSNLGCGFSSSSTKDTRTKPKSAVAARLRFKDSQIQDINH